MNLFVRFSFRIQYKRLRYHGFESRKPYCTGVNINEKQYDNIRVEVEKKWLPIVRKQDESCSSDVMPKPKFYVLSMFPYPSGNLHMGHVRVYTQSDAFARYHRLNGKNVLHPIGWDSFGLPAENAAIERGELPAVWTLKNINQMKQQLEELCLSFDWKKEISTCDPSYYAWTQELFLKLFNDGLAYQKKAPVNWDPIDCTVLANEQIDENGCAWRSGAKVEKKFLKQWYIKNTTYTQQLLAGLNELDPRQWNYVSSRQKWWMGFGNGIRIELPIMIDNCNTDRQISIFCKDPHSLYYASHILIPPSHELNIHKSSEADRNLGIFAFNPVNNQNIPIFVSYAKKFDDFCDFYIGNPLREEEDKCFADENGLTYFSLDNNTMSKKTLEEWVDYFRGNKIFSYIAGEKSLDWLISRQRYWGAPIPIIHCPHDGAVPVKQCDLPVKLPNISKSSTKGEIILSNNEQWVLTSCPICGTQSKRETDTMDTFVDSSWYFLRYTDPSNKNAEFDTNNSFYFMPVDLYIGGKEHAEKHLYYARFVNHFYHKLNLVPTREPFVKFLMTGLILGKSYQTKTNGQYIPPRQVLNSNGKLIDKSSQIEVVENWEKMSKSKFNGVDPQDIINEFGIDATRICILSSDPNTDYKWDDGAMVRSGARKWQWGLWSLVRNFVKLRNNDNSMYPSTDTDGNYDKDIYELRNNILLDIKYQFEHGLTLSIAFNRLQEIATFLKKVPISLKRNSIQYERTLLDLIIMTAPFAPLFSSELWSCVSKVDLLTQTYNPNVIVLEQSWPLVDNDFKVYLTVRKDMKTVILKYLLPVPHYEISKFTYEGILNYLRKEKEFMKYAEKYRRFDLILEPGNKVALEIFTNEESWLKYSSEKK